MQLLRYELNCQLCQDTIDQSKNKLAYHAYTTLLDWCERRGISDSSEEYAIVEEVYASCLRRIHNPKGPPSPQQLKGYAIKIANKRLASRYTKSMLLEILSGHQGQELFAITNFLKNGQGD